MADNENQNPNEHEEPIIRDKRRIDPVTGEVRGVGGEQAAGAESSASAAAASEQHGDLGDSSLSDEDLEGLLSGEGADQAPAEDELHAGAANPSPEAQLAEERLQDLLRVQAEYANYRNRTDRERAEQREVVTADVLRSLLPVLDDLDRAAKHGDLDSESAMGVIASKLRGILERTGLKPYGEAGDAFDPNIHEAIAQLPNPDVTSETVADVVELGYVLGERTVRVAKVAVFVPAS